MNDEENRTAPAPTTNPVDEEKKRDKRNRTSARTKFTRTYNVIAKCIDDKDAETETLKDMFVNLEEAYTKLEDATEEYLNHLESEDDEFEQSNAHLEKSYESLCELRVKLSKKEIGKPSSRKSGILTVNGKGSSTMHVKKLSAPSFTGNIREFPTFMKDYSTYMEPIYGEESYALRSCLSGKALEVVIGVDDNYQEMWKRLKLMYCDSEKVVDSILSEIKSLKPVRSDNPVDLIHTVTVVERCYLDLKRLDLAHEMNTSSMTSHVERLLPPIQKREWTIYKQNNIKESLKFDALLEFLLREKAALEYMSGEIRDDRKASGSTFSTIAANENVPSEQSANVNLTQGNNSAAGNFDSISTLQRAVEELTKAISSNNSTNNLRSGSSGINRKPATNTCWVHNSDAHNITECNTFKNSSNEEKMKLIKQKGVCFGCLKTGHLSRDCTSRRRCDVNIGMNDNSEPILCNKSHHPLLHDAHITGVSFVHVSNQTTNNNKQTLLMLCKVNCIKEYYNAMLDPCSNISLITHSAAKRLNLKGRDVSMSITKVGNVTELIATKEYILPLKDVNNKTWNIIIYGINEITSNISKVDVKDVISLFNNIRYQDIERPVGRVDILLGLDCCTLLPNKVSQRGNLQLMYGLLGYCLRGSHELLKFESGLSSVNTVNAFIHKSISHVNNNTVHINPINVKDQIQEFFKLESLGTSLLDCEGCKQRENVDINKNNITIKEKHEMDLIRSGLSYNKEYCRWTVSYPWIRDACELPNNYKAAFGQLISLEKRLAKLTDGSSDLYDEQIKDMIERRVARKLTDKEIKDYKGPVHYVPHHGILKTSSNSTPLRIVFNASASYMGHKLNDYWAKGPNMLNSLIGVLLKFREDLVAMLGDVSKMYNSVLLGIVEQHTHRFLWRNSDISSIPDHYIMLAVPFGDCPSGAIVIIAMFQTAMISEKEFPQASKTIRNNSYVDDILKSVSTREAAKKLSEEVDVVLSKGGFKIKKWIYSGNETQTEDNLSLNFEDPDDEKVLGMRWDPKEDSFKFKTNAIVRDHYTRRSALSQISRLYDPLGLLTPFTLTAKLIMRDICTTSGDEPQAWDEQLTSKLNNRLKGFFTEMSSLDSISFHRSIKPNGAKGSPSLILFSDGSQQAYGACAYARWLLEDGTYTANLICSKSRLAPAKTLSIPRIELMGAIVACRLRNVIVKEMEIEFESIYHIIDSQIVLEQIRKDSHKCGVFVGNRVAEIQNSSLVSDWWWTDTINNAADRLTRPSSVYKINEEWKHGPSYLTTPLDNWPISQDRIVTSHLPDVKGEINSVKSTTNPNLGNINLNILGIERYSNVMKLIRVTSILLMVLRNKSFKCDSLNISAEELSTAQKMWIKFVQGDIIDNWSKRFKRLGPVMGKDGILLVGNRITEWIKNNYNRDLLILLPNKSQFSKLIVQGYHNVNHDGIDTTVARVRSEYWIPHLYKLVKKVKKSCYQCRRSDKILCSQKMGVLPKERVNPSPPFYYSGVDLFGPIWITDCVKKRVKLKCYGVIFNCFTTRAIYLDIACGYDTDNFLMVLRRFIAIRGCPAGIYSDPGSQLIAAGKEIREYLQQLDQNAVHKFNSDHGINWTTTKSADAPWQNGCTERLIRSVKRCLWLTIGENKLTFPELQTVFFECANLMNDRPIGVKSSDHTYFCPNHLLLGRSSMKSLYSHYDNSSNYKKRFKFIDNLTQTFWKRWQIHYFPSLILQHKWHVDKRNLCVGDIVLVQDSAAIRGQWKLAEVCCILHSKDDKVRDVELRYKSQSPETNYKGSKDIRIRRSVHRLVLLVPVEERSEINA